MASIIEEVRLIFCEADANSNKVWEGRLYDDNAVETRWGRIGLDLQSKMFPGKGKIFLDKKKREKIDKGYTELKTVSNTGVAKTAAVSNNNLATIAKQQISVGSPQLTKLIDRLVASNIHQITSSTQITYNASTGLFSTPLGIVTPDGITEARDLLVEVKKNFKSEAKLKPLVSKYLRLIPHDIGMKFNIYSIFPDEAQIEKENDILDSLEASYAALSSAPQSTGATAKQAVEKVFAVKLDIVDSSDKEFNRIKAWYDRTNKHMHGYTNYRINAMYKVDMEDMVKAFDNKLGTITEVWHGTSQANLLSILKSGLRVSPPSSAYIAGKMFGNGVYGSQTASKSLGYTMGRWGGHTSESGWLFVCDFAMGNAFYPNTYGLSNIPKGYDSCWALPKNTGLHNDELIVYKNNQLNIKYLLEIK